MDFDRLRAAMGPVADSATAASAVGVSTRTFLRWQQAGRVPASAADRVAVALGTHPAVIWPDWIEGQQAMEMNL